MHLMDQKSMADAGTMSSHSQREYLAWSNSLERLLRRLGAPAAERQQSPTELIWAARAASIED
jgi:hypothetical protein